MSVQEEIIGILIYRNVNGQIQSMPRPYMSFWQHHSSKYDKVVCIKQCYNFRKNLFHFFFSSFVRQLCSTLIFSREKTEVIFAKRITSSCEQTPRSRHQANAGDYAIVVCKRCTVSGLLPRCSSGQRIREASKPLINVWASNGSEGL